VAVGTLLARLELSAAPTVGAGSAVAPAATSSTVRATAATAAPRGLPPRLAAGGRAAAFLSPAVRALARRHGLTSEQVAAVPGSGRGGRVTLPDLTRWVTARPASSAAEPPAAADVEVVPMAGMRARIAEHMVAARRTAAHVNTVAEADMSAIAAARRTHGPAFEDRHGFALSWNAFFLKACAGALAEFPVVNAILDERGIVTHRRVHLGMAVALEPSGLVVPVLRDAHLMSVRQLAVEAQRLSEGARAKKLSPDDYSGGTCTVTNPGVFGNLLGTPIIHVPQAAIIDFGAIKRRVVVLPGDAIAIRPMAYVVLAWDHRVMDGATAARFLQRLVRGLESFPTDGID
jgi:2-oxoglutarate dehydrogenase E2 component (dihydrolipoamide succinyltransferase)